MEIKRERECLMFDYIYHWCTSHSQETMEREIITRCGCEAIYVHTQYNNIYIHIIIINIYMDILLVCLVSIYGKYEHTVHSSVCLLNQPAPPPPPPPPPDSPEVTQNPSAPCNPEEPSTELSQDTHSSGHKHSVQGLMTFWPNLARHV